MPSEAKEKMSGTNEKSSRATAAVSYPTSLGESPSFSRPSLGITEPQEVPAAATKSTPIRTPWTPTRLSNLTPTFLTPLSSPLRKALGLTRLDLHDAWLPVTESRNGNKYYAAFHTLCSGIGVQALVMPVAFLYLGWIWGIISLTVAFVWQLYTLWILVQLHEPTETGMRYSRYLHLLCSALGNRWGKLLAAVQIVYLSVGTCVASVIIGASSLKAVIQIACGPSCSAKLTTVEWYLVFTSAAALVSQLPNLNSIAGVSLLGAATAIGYCTVIWVVSVAKGRLPGVSYKPIREGKQVDRIFYVLNAIGIIAFTFRGHNLTLEIQGTMPSDEKRASHVPMWKGVEIAYTIIALCLYPIAVGGYWAYGQKIPQNEGMLGALNMFHYHDVPHWILIVTSLFVVINSVSSFQIYAMPAFDYLESIYTRKKKKPCSWWLRASIRTLFGYLAFFVAVAIPVLSSVAGVAGGLALPLTLAYPCFMWIKIRKPKTCTGMWWLNWGLGISGMCLSALIMVAGFYVWIKTGLKLSFFHPQ